MFPMMWDQLPCRNMEVTKVIQSRPALMLFATRAHRSTKSSPPASSSMNANPLSATIATVTIGSVR